MATRGIFRTTFANFFDARGHLCFVSGKKKEEIGEDGRAREKTHRIPVCGHLFF